MEIYEETCIFLHIDETLCQYPREYRARPIDYAHGRPEKSTFIRLGHGLWNELKNSNCSILTGTAIVFIGYPVGSPLLSGHVGQPRVAHTLA